MPSLKDIRTRIKSVKTTQQTTKAMKMVSASKLRRAQDLIINLRPYAGKLKGLMQHVAKEGDVESPYVSSRPANQVLLVVVSSSRGLCGGFNNNLFKIVNLAIQEQYAEHAASGRLRLLCVGKKSYDYYRKRGYTLVGDQHDVFAKLNFDQVNDVAKRVMEGFVAEEWDHVDLFYNQFKNIATQVRTQEPFLPVQTDIVGAADAGANDFIFEPDKATIVTELIPRILKMQFYRAVLESNASEQGARMIAMDNATENAEDLLHQLKLTFNKARQASITKEILEIVGGAEALSSS